jgi:hypothetical protein
MPGDSGATVVDLLVWFCFFPCEAAGANRHPAFPTPSVFRAGVFGMARVRFASRGTGAWLFENLDRQSDEIPSRARRIELAET